MDRATLSLAGMVLAAALAAACQPEAIVVSDTEAWTLQLEQIDDGQPTQGQNAFPRRGTITVRLNLNRTSQPDPTCVGKSSRITTVLATAHALDSRLQPDAMGSFDGSWNCHGFRATLALDDGTRYDLVSSDSDGHFGDLAHFDQDGNETLDHRWRSGGRNGFFLLIQDDHRTRAIDSYMDVQVRNTSNQDLQLTLLQPNPIDHPFEQVYRCCTDVRAGATRLLSWPAHSSRRDPDDPQGERPETYVWETFAPGRWSINSRAWCILSFEHPDLVEIELTGAQPGECGAGWLGATHLDARREHYLLPETTAQVALRYAGVDTVWARSSDPALSATVAFNRFGEGSMLTLEALPGLSLTDHGVVLWARDRLTGDSISIVLTVYIYDLAVTMHPDTIETVPGGSGSAWFSIVRRGVAAAFMEVSFDPDRTGTPYIDFLESWRFDPNPTLDTVAFLSFRVGQEERTELLRVCVRYVAIDYECSPRDVLLKIERPRQRGMIPASVHNQIERVATPAQVLPAVRVVDPGQGGVPGITITFRTADANSGSITGATAVTDASGVATVGGWTLGPTAGTQTMIANAPAGSGIQPLSLRFTVQANPGPPARAPKVAGDNQSAPAGSPVAVPPRLRVTDVYGNPIGGVQVLFAIEAGGGSVTGGQTVTASDGEASVGSWTLGPTPGVNLLVAYVTGLPAAVQFAATGQ